MPYGNVDQSRPLAVPRPSQQHLDRGYGANAKTATPSLTDEGFRGDRQQREGNVAEYPQAPSNYGRFHEDWDASQRGSSITDGDKTHHSHTPSMMAPVDQTLPRRSATLKKKASLRSGSRRSSRAGSVRSLALQPEPTDEMHSAFYSPIPTSGNPTEHLANRFAAWRKLLKDLITYFREIQSGYDHRGKSLAKISNLASNITAPNNFLHSGGINDAMQMLSDYHKQTVLEANKAKLIEEDVIQALTGLRSDLQQKIKEIKNLSGDFKNSVDREMDATRKAVRSLEDALGQSDIDASAKTGKQDPYLLRLAVDRQLERQLDEENYLHQAYLNLETSGRELEAIVVGEIQKAYNAYTGILKREADEAYNAIENLRTGPVAMPKDYEWNGFIEADEHFVDPRVPVRRIENIHYSGRDHELAQEVRAGLLERKSKYLKSYSAGWYVLSPTHLHEFKTADKSQAPIMSLYLPEQKLGSHSNEDASSNKFMLKGRQTGTMHRGHSWVFRAESYDTMMAWYEDVKSLTDAAPQERNAFVRSHARSFSGASQRAASISSDGAMDDEDEEPFSTTASAVVQNSGKQDAPRRPEPGGRFPSDIQVDPARRLQVPLSPSSTSSSIGNNDDREAIAAATNLPGGGIETQYPHLSLQSRRSASYGHRGATSRPDSHADQLEHEARKDGLNPYTYQPLDIEQGPHSAVRQQVEDSKPFGVTPARGFDSPKPEPVQQDSTSFIDLRMDNQRDGTCDGDVITHREALVPTATLQIPGDGDSHFSTPINDPSTNIDAPLAGVHPISDQKANDSQHLENARAAASADVDNLKGHPVHEVSAMETEMHVPGEYPQATPLTEDVMFST